jgi:hypothetical protein
MLHEHGRLSEFALSLPVDIFLPNNKGEQPGIRYF